MIVEGLALEGQSASAIHETLQALRRVELLKGTLPTLRTVQRITREGATTKPDREIVPPSGAEDRRLALDAARELILTKDGNIPWPSAETIAWMSHLVQQAPSLEPEGLWSLALAYRNRMITQRPVADLEAWLAFRPWESDERCRTYFKAANAGWIPRLPWFDPIPYDPDEPEASLWDPLLCREHPISIYGGEANENDPE